MQNINTRNERMSPAASRRPLQNALPFVCVLLAAIVLPTLTQAQQVTTEMIGPLAGSLTINFPSGPCFGQQDTISLAGNIHVVAAVDPSQGTVAYHYNLLGVKCTGTVVSKYINPDLTLNSVTAVVGQT